MKKIFAIVLSLVLIMSLSVTAFAASSPVAGQKVTIIFVAHEDAKVDVDTHEWHGELTVTYTAKEEHEGEKFVGWSIFLKDGSVAIEGKHYKLVKRVAGAYAEKADDVVAYRVAGNIVLADATIEIVPLTDLIITANYGDTATSVDDAVKAFQATSVPTGDVTVFGLSALLVVALAGVAVSKKQLAK